VGVAQRIVGHFNSTNYSGQFEKMLTEMRKDLWEKIIGPEFAVANTVKNVLPHLAQECLSGTILAQQFNNGLELVQFNHSAAPEFATEALPFVAIGSGQPTADPFLAFIRRILWKKPPTMADGIFAVWWTLHHAITVSPGGIADPKQIAVLEWKQDGKNKRCAARELDESELKETEEAVRRAENHIQKFDRNVTVVEDGPKPMPPPPPPSPPLA
jgi:hypothetical protein